ncbi:MAG: hypothetical protein K0S07_281 [Chlamydiales bacterium]|nr:hypothetical protein [Chlamydiales bacterium]
MVLLYFLNVDKAAGEPSEGKIQERENGVLEKALFKRLCLLRFAWLPFIEPLGDVGLKFLNL